MLCWPATAAWSQTTTSWGHAVNGARAYLTRRPRRTAVTIGPGRSLRARLSPTRFVPSPPPVSAAVPDPGRRRALIGQDDPPINEEPHRAHLVRRNGQQGVSVPGRAGLHG